MALSPVGPYRVLERLGAGANGEVCLAEDTRLHRRVALKTLSGTAAGDGSDLRRRLLREARAAARLNHPHIAAVYDVIEADDGVHIVMEYVRGTTLAARIRQGAPSPMQVVDIALQLSGALAHAHGLGVIHRDLKPANIVVTPDGATKILDFGLARLQDVDAGSVPLSGSEPSVGGGQVVGTPPYIPPEHLSGAPVDARGDIYSLGVTLFELLTGRRPFEASNGLGLSQAILSAPTPRVRALCPDCPEGFDAIVYRAMSRNPNDRYASAADMAADLKRLSAGITDVPTQSRPAWPLAGVGGRPRLAWAAAAVAVLAIAGYASMGLLRNGDRTTADAAGLAAGPKVVAVLPLAGVAGELRNEILAAGLAETLIGELEQLPGLTVIPRSDTLKYRDQASEPDTIARELGATLYISGVIDPSRERPGIALGLHRPGVKAPLWQDTFEADLSARPALKQGVARAVANALHLPAPRGDRGAHSYRNDEAFSSYSHARSLLERPDVPGNVERSIEFFQKAIASDPQYARAHAGLGEALWRQYQATREKDLSRQALLAITKALSFDPDDNYVRLSLGTMYRAMGDMTGAATQLTLVIESMPESDEAHRQLGLVLLAMGERDRGFDHLREAIRLRPSFWSNHASLGSAYYNLGNYTEAAKSFRKITELRPESAWGYSMLGSAHHAMDDTGAATELYRKAIGLGSAAALANLAALHYEQRDYEEAAKHYAAAVGRDSASPLLHLNLADAYARLGRSAEANSAYRRALELSRGHLSANPTDTRALARMAVIESKLGRAADADRHIAEAVAREPGNADVIFHQVVIHVRAGRPDQAVQALARALDHGYSRKRADSDPELAPLRSLVRYQTLMTGVTKGGAS